MNTNSTPGRPCRRAKATASSKVPQSPGLLVLPSYPWRRDTGGLSNLPSGLVSPFLQAIHCGWL